MLCPYPFSIIYAIGSQGEFGLTKKPTKEDGGKSLYLPWGNIKEDMHYFTKITRTPDKNGAENIVIMGRETFETIGKPLPGRINIVLSSTIKSGEKYQVASNLQEAWEMVREYVRESGPRKVFVIGGAKLIQRLAPYAERIHETLIERASEPVKFPADIFMDFKENHKNRQLALSETIISSDSKFQLTFSIFTFPQLSTLCHPETSYLNLLERILLKGLRTVNRTGIDTISVWGEQIKIPMFDCGFPMLTTKSVPFRGVVQELLFFISGKTNTKVLEDAGVKIWKGNSSREFLDKNGLQELNEGEIGELYPFHWRHFGAIREPNQQLEIGQGGVDQLKNIIEDINLVKSDPSHPKARRLIVTSWNPSTLNKAPLSACHMLYQFQVRDKRLNCAVTFRSWDVPVGGGFNIASYSLLTYMICHLTDLIPGDLVISANDCHIYMNVLEQVKIQLTRVPKIWPRLEIVGKYESIDDFHGESFRLYNYDPHPGLKMVMAI